MSITGVSHIAIGVRDMERSLAFYCDGLGLVVSMERLEVDPPGTTMFPRNRRACYLRWDHGPGTSYLVLDQHLAEEAPGGARQMYDAGVHHFAFSTDDIEATVARLQEHGFEVRHVGHVGKGTGSGIPDGDHEIATCFADDPDGNIIQFDQWLS